MTRHRFACLVLAGWLIQAAVSADSQQVASRDDAYIARDKASDTWTIGNDGIALTVGFDRAGDYRIVAVADRAGGRDWGFEPGPDTWVTIDGDRLALGAKSDGFTLRIAEAIPTETGVRLALTFELRSLHILATRYYAVFPHAPVVETWTSLQVPAGIEGVSVADLNAFDFKPPSGAVRWLTGQQVAKAEGGAFTLHRRDLQPGERLQFGAQGRSSETFVPWLGLEVPGGRFFGGLMWSGAWSAFAERDDEGGVRVQMGLTGMMTDIPDDQTLEMPHGFFGITAGGDADASAALREYIARGVRGGRPFEAPVVYNTWFAYGTGIDESIIREEIDRNADLGTEVFVLDAGWYQGAQSVFDFTSGLGSWEADQVRFPEGLVSLADHARDRGMRFGLWVEPGRIALDLVDRPGLAREEWLVKRDGKYDPGKEDQEVTAAQICLADSRAQQWIFDRLVRLLEEVRPDYLKWDDNHWVSCNRPGHGHGALDGNFKQTDGLYQILGALREWFPNLAIENVSGGGNRLDFGMLRYSDVGWMDDRTAPSTHVRHNLEGLSSVFPPAYLFSFVRGTVEEPLHDVQTLARSRMPGVLGLTFRTAELTPSEYDELRREIATYKNLREVLRNASAGLLTPQISEDAAADWDAIQMSSATSGEAVIYVFAGADAPEQTIVRPIQLAPDSRYEVTSVDQGILGYASGADLMAHGIEVVGPPQSAHILIMRPQPAETPVQNPLRRHP